MKGNTRHKQITNKKNENNITKFRNLCVHPVCSVVYNTLNTRAIRHLSMCDVFTDI